MTRDQLIDEIVQEEFPKYAAFIESSGNGSTEIKMKAYQDYLRNVLLRISNASMDAVEVEMEDEVVDTGGESFVLTRKHAYNSAITASKEKRSLFTIDSKNSG